MTFAEIATEIAALLAAVTGIENVYVGKPYTTAPQDIQDRFVKNKVLQTWWVTRERTEVADIGVQYTRERHEVVIEAFHVITESLTSQGSFLALLDAALAKLHANRLLANSAGRISTPAKLDRTDEVRYLDALCWHARILVGVEAGTRGGNVWT